jgi:hypothetical protein
MLDNDPPPNALIAKNEREHRLHRLRSEWRLFPQSRPLIESDIQWHPEWGIAVSGEELIAVAAREPIDIPKSTRARSDYASAPFDSAHGKSLSTSANLDPIGSQISTQTPQKSCSSRLNNLVR